MTSTFTFTVADCAQDRVTTVGAATEADALKRVYETLCDWNDDEPDLRDAIEVGVIWEPNYKGDRFAIKLAVEPARFWRAAASSMLGDNQDFVAGDASPFPCGDGE